MVQIQARSVAPDLDETRSRQPGTLILRWLTSTDHKTIGNAYFITTMVFFMFGGALALAMRSELAAPGIQYLSYEV